MPYNWTRPKDKSQHGEIHSLDKEQNSLFDASLEMEKLLEVFEANLPTDMVFTPVQIFAIQETVSSSMHEAMGVDEDHVAQSRRCDNL